MVSGGPPERADIAPFSRVALHPASRSRGTLLCHDGATRHGGVTQTKTASGKLGAVQNASFLSARQTILRDDLNFEAAQLHRKHFHEIDELIMAGAEAMRQFGKVADKIE